MNRWRLRERAVALVGLLAALLTIMASTAQGQSVVINEIHTAPGAAIMTR